MTIYKFAILEFYQANKNIQLNIVLKLTLNCSVLDVFSTLVNFKSYVTILTKPH